MYPIAAALKLAISFYHIPVTVWDTEYVTTDGQDVREIVATRIIQAALDPTRSKDLERIFA